MVGAVGEGVDGIDAECGGACNCATCHVFVSPEWLDRIPPAGQQEREILEEISAKDERSRLSCQIDLTDGLEGLVVHRSEEHTSELQSLMRISYDVFFLKKKKKKHINKS